MSDLVELVNKAGSLGLFLEIAPQFNGQGRKDGNTLFRFNSVSSLENQLNGYEHKLKTEANAKIFVNSTKVLVANDGKLKSGKVGTVCRYDRMDDTVLVGFGNETSWLSASRLSVYVHVYKVKDDVKINGENGKRGMIVAIEKTDPPYLVYDYDEDETYYYSAEDIEPA